VELVKGIKNWLCGGLQGKMGQFQYSSHEGSWKGKATSGVILWQEILENSDLYSMPSAEKRLLPKIANDIPKYVLDGLPVIDLGCGGEHAMRDKLAPIAKAVKSSRVILVDGSHSLLTLAQNTMRQLTDVSITRVMDDFLDEDNTQYVDRAALVTYTGITIGNIDANALSEKPPADELTNHIERICAKAFGGYVLVTYDSSLDENLNKAAYEEHLPFHLNFLDRAVVEHDFPEEVRDRIVYRAVPGTWFDEISKPIAGVVSHYAEFTEDASFNFEGEHFAIAAGTRFLMKNSFKYSAAFFEECVSLSGALVIETWSEGSIIGVLLKAPYISALQKKEPQAA
jgi:uncharacterized SAM-dependent methyltransferase